GPMAAKHELGLPVEQNDFPLAIRDDQPVRQRFNHRADQGEESQPIMLGRGLLRIEFDQTIDRARRGRSLHERREIWAGHANEPTGWTSVVICFVRSLDLTCMDVVAVLAASVDVLAGTGRDRGGLFRLKALEPARCAASIPERSESRVTGR